MASRIFHSQTGARLTRMVHLLRITQARPESAYVALPLFEFANYHDNAMLTAMNGTISVDKLGRLVIPKKFRTKAGTNIFAPSWTSKGLLLEPVIEKPRRLVRIKGLLVAIDDGVTRDVAREVREERDRQT